MELGACVSARSDAGACDPACAAHEECAGQSCAARYSAVVITAPANGAGAKPGASVPVSVSLTLAPGRTEALPNALTLEVKAPGGAVTTQQLTRSGSAFTGEWTAATTTGAYELTAVYAEAALRSSAVTVAVDATAPTVTLSLAPPPARPPTDGGTTYLDPMFPDGGAYRRDDEVVVTLSSNDADIDASASAVTASIAGGTSATFAITPATGCGASYCAAATVNLWQIPMAAARGTLTVTATVRDTAGNEATAQKSADVTRWKWMNSVPGTAVIGSPPLDSRGNLYIGYSTAASGWIRSLNPEGRLRWIRSGGGAVTASGAVGDADGGEVVVFGEQSGANSTLAALDVRDGGTVASCGAYSGTFRGSIALTSTTLSTEVKESAFAHVSGNGGRVVAFRIGAGTGDDCITLSGVGAMPTDPTSIVTRGDDAYFGDSLGQVAGYRFNNGAWSAQANWPSDAGLFTRALAVHGSNVVAGGGGPGRGGLFSISPAGGPPAWELRTSAPAWSPAIAAGGTAFMGTDGPALVSAALFADAGTTTPTADVVRGTPVIGEGGWLYLPSIDGTVSVRPLSAPATIAWNLTGLGQLETSATLDCARDGNGQARAGRPGTLYAVASSGEVYAIIVDSRGLDATAPWPKYQHDPQNSGNPARPIISCP